MKIKAKETFKISGTSVIVEAGQEFEIIEGKMKVLEGSLWDEFRAFLETITTIYDLTTGEMESNLSVTSTKEFSVSSVDVRSDSCNIHTKEGVSILFYFSDIKTMDPSRNGTYNIIFSDRSQLIL